MITKVIDNQQRMIGNMVKGIYAIPADAELIRVKITDLIAQSVEISVDMKNVCKK